MPRVQPEPRYEAAGVRRIDGAFQMKTATIYAHTHIQCVYICIPGHKEKLTELQEARKAQLGDFSDVMAEREEKSKKIQESAYHSAEADRS